MKYREFWVPVKGYEGLYEVSQSGQVRGTKRQGTNGNPLKAQRHKNGYLTVELCRNGKRKGALVHRIVAEAFLDNPYRLPCVNHKDENKENNAVENLEWCSYSYNNTYGTAAIRRIATIGRPCRGVWPDGEERTYKNCADAGRDLNLSQGSIWGCCNGRWKTSGGAEWSYI